MNSSRSSSSEAAPAVHRFVVRPQDAGLRLDKVLGEQPQITSREMARRLIDIGAVRLNAKAEAPSTKVRPADVVEFAVPPPTPLDIPAQEGPLDVLYEDDHVIVINKPAGMPMHPGPGHAQGTLVNYLLHHCPTLSGIGGVRRPGIVHRLDKDTSGVVVTAKHDRAHLALSAQFKAHTVIRSYLAVVVGTPPRDAGTVDMPVGRHAKNRIKRAVRANGKRAVTHWQVEARRPPLTVLRLRLETGRTHQIRVHMAEQGWPVLGDPLYGGARPRGIRVEEPLRGIMQAFPRQALHAQELGFDHPESGKPLHFIGALPQDMATLLEQIGVAPPKPSAAPSGG